MNNNIKDLESSLSTCANMHGDTLKQASSFRDIVFVKMNSLRLDIDKLESSVDSKIWPFPTYGDLLYYV